MPTSERRAFLKQAGAGLVGAAAFAASRSRAVGAGEQPPATSSIPPHRALALSGVHAYTDRQSVPASEAVAFLVSSSVPYRLSVCRLGLEVDNPDSDTVLHEFPESSPRVQAIHPGSYVHIERSLPGSEALRALTLECWVRPWRIDRWAGLVTQHDYPHAGGVGLFVRPEGSVTFDLGDGRAYRAERSLASPPQQLEAGRWSHVVGTFHGRTATLWIDGKPVARRSIGGTVKPGPSPLRLAAYGHEGLADHFLDGDLAMPAIYGRALNEDEIVARYRSQGLEIADRQELLACWPLTEERGDAIADVSSHARTGRIINHATWMIGGPSFDANVPRFGDYDPGHDPKRGHGLRFASDDLYDCRWQATNRFRIPEGAPSGIYVGRIRYEMDGESYLYHTTFIVTRNPRRPKAPILVQAATNTWRAYSGAPFSRAQPGRKHVSGTGGMANSPGDPPAYCLYRGHAAGQGTYQMGLRMPWPAAGPYILYGGPTDYSHLMRAERFAQIWLERAGYDFDVISDLDLHQDPDQLRGYKVLVISGHNEYWSIPMYDGLRRFLENGSNLVVLSGNTMFWRVSFNEDGSIMECRKVDAPGNQMPPERRGECWHSQDGRRGGLTRECGYPSAQLIGLDTLGWNNPSDPTHFGPFIIEQPDHFLFNRPSAIGIQSGDPIGQAPDGGLPRANGHEVDVRVSTLRKIMIQMIPDGATHPDDPPGIQLLAAGKDWPESAASFDFFFRPVKPAGPIGGEMIYWQRPNGGRVFNAGAIGAGWALAADTKFQALLSNVLDHFGVTPK